MKLEVDEAMVKIAEAQIPLLTKRRDSLADELADVNAKLGATVAFVNAYRPKSAALPRDEAPKFDPTLETSSERAPRGQVYDHVRQVLLASGKPITRTQVHKETERRFGVKYGSSSVYRALMRGLDSGWYQNKAGYWSLGPELKEGK